mgnify:CR=1 FL=1
MKIKSHKSFARSSLVPTKLGCGESLDGHVVTDIGIVSVGVYRSESGMYKSRSFEVYYKGKMWSHYSNEGVTLSPRCISRQAREFAEQVMNEARRIEVAKGAK